VRVLTDAVALLEPVVDAESDFGGEGVLVRVGLGYGEQESVMVQEVVGDWEEDGDGDGVALTDGTGDEETLKLCEKGVAVTLEGVRVAVSVGWWVAVLVEEQVTEGEQDGGDGLALNDFVPVPVGDHELLGMGDSDCESECVGV